MTHFFPRHWKWSVKLWLPWSQYRVSRSPSFKRITRAKVSAALSAFAFVKATRGVAYHPTESAEDFTGYRCVTTRKKRPRSTISFLFSSEVTARWLDPTNTVWCAQIKRVAQSRVRARACPDNNISDSRKSRALVIHCVRRPPKISHTEIAERSRATDRCVLKRDRFQGEPADFSCCRFRCRRVYLFSIYETRNEAGAPKAREAAPDRRLFR